MTLETGCVILLDGRHAFPTPFIDWFYLNRHLKTNGWLIIDDTLLWTGKTLVEFLDSEGGWDKIFETENTTVFKKISTIIDNDKWWGQQKFILDMAIKHPLYNSIVEMVRQSKKEKCLHFCHQTCPGHFNVLFIALNQIALDIQKKFIIVKEKILFFSRTD